jgi:hypothetical protein
MNVFLECIKRRFSFKMKKRKRDGVKKKKKKREENIFWKRKNFFFKEISRLYLLESLQLTEVSQEIST